MGALLKGGVVMAGAGAKCAAVPWLEAAHTQAGFLDVIYVLFFSYVKNCELA